MQPLRADTQVVVHIGPFPDVGDGFTPQVDITLGGDEAELLKHNATTVVDISGRTWAAIASCRGWYNLTLTTDDTDTEGMLEVIVQDDSDCLPVHARFMVVNANVYDSLYGTAAADYLQVDLTHVMGTILTEGGAGRLAAAIIKLFDVASPLLVASDVMRGTNSANTVVPDAAGVVATALGLLETHGDSTWTTATGFNVVTPDAAGVVATALGLLETHGDSTWATATGFNVVTPDAAGVVATALGLLETHGDSTWATGNIVVPDAAGVVATALGLLETHGDSTWATATGFNVVTPDAAGVMATALGLHDAKLDTAQLDLNTITGANGVFLDDDAITANKYDESTAWPVKADDSGATYIARTGADSDTLETLSDQIDGVGGASGSGGDTVTMTITVSGVPLADAGVWISTDAVSANVVAGTLRTDSSGERAFLLDNGSAYYFWAKKVGYNLPQGTAFTAATAHTFTGTAATSLNDLTETLVAIRRLLNDEMTGQESWSDAVLLRYLSDAQRALYRRRPDAFLSATGMNPPVELTSAADQIKVDTAYRDMLVWHTCASALGEDADDRGNMEKAAEFMARFQQAVARVK